MVVSVVRIFLIRQKQQIRQIQLYGNQDEKDSLHDANNAHSCFNQV